MSEIKGKQLSEGSFRKLSTKSTDSSSPDNRSVIEIVDKLCVKWHGSCDGCRCYDETLIECSFLRELKEELRIHGKE